MELSKGRIIWLSLLLGTLSAYGPLLMDAYLPAFPVIQEELGISASLTQMSLTMCLIGLALGPLAIGTLSDRIGRKKPLAIGITVAILCCLLVPFVRNIWLFLALRLLQGIASSAGIVLTRAIAKDLFTDADCSERYFPDHFPTARQCDFGSGFLANDFSFFGWFRHLAIAWYSLWLSGNITAARTHPSDGIWLAGSIV